MNVQNRMGEIIHDLRVRDGLTMEELGAKVGVQSSAVNKWEKGLVKNIKQSTIQKLSDIFDVTPTYLMGYEDLLSEPIKTYSYDRALKRAKPADFSELEKEPVILTDLNFSKEMPKLMRDLELADVLKVFYSDKKDDLVKYARYLAYAEKLNDED